MVFTFKKTTTKNKTCHNYILFGSFCEHEDELPSDILKQPFQIRLQANWQDDVKFADTVQVLSILCLIKGS